MLLCYPGFDTPTDDRRIVKHQKEAFTDAMLKSERMVGYVDRVAPDSRGVLCFGSRIWIPKHGGLRDIILAEAHQSRLSVHPGTTKMYRNLVSDFWWPGLKKDVRLFVEKCITCLQVKAEHQKPYGELQPLDIPKWKWEEIAMDFITKLPKTQRQHDTIWVVIDRLTKSAHFLPARENYSMDKWAEL